MSEFNIIWYPTIKRKLYDLIFNFAIVRLGYLIRLQKLIDLKIFVNIRELRLKIYFFFLPSWTCNEKMSVEMSFIRFQPQRHKVTRNSRASMRGYTYKSGDVNSRLYAWGPKKKKKTRIKKKDTSQDINHPLANISNMRLRISVRISGISAPTWQPRDSNRVSFF